MRVIAGGPGRKSGKTSLVERIIRATPEKQWTAVKISHHPPESGAPYEILEERDASESGDTRRYLRAGAARAYWVRGDLGRALDELRALLAGAENWIVESNRAMRLLDHDLEFLSSDTEAAIDEKLRKMSGDREPELD